MGTKQDTSPDMEAVPKYRSFFVSARFGLAIICFLMCFHIYAQRVGMSVAIVCMVNHTAIAELRHAETGHVNMTSQDDRPINASDAGTSLCARATLSGSNDSASADGPFVWKKEYQGHILGAFFYGYLVSQIPGGLLAERFGAKWILFAFFGLSSIGTLLTPAAARFGYAALIVTRVFVGVGSGAMYPAMHAMWGQWAPPMERSKLAGISYAGAMMGSVVAMPMSGVLCQYGFDGGWGSVFYTIGGSSLVILVLWALLASSTPASCGVMSAAEKSYITNSLTGQVSDTKISWTKMPWLEFAKSGPLWAIIVANFCMDWGGYTLMTNIPTFYKEVLKFDIQSNGLFSALPFIGLWASMNISPVTADHLRAKRILSTTAVRKIFTSIGLFGGAGALVALSFLDCRHTGLAVALMSIGVTVTGIGLSGYWVNHMDIAPDYAGTLLGISNGLAAMSGFMAPYVAAALTTEQSREAWQVVFFISAAIYSLGAIVYIVLGSGVIQPWAITQTAAEVEMSINMLQQSPKKKKVPTATLR